MFIITHRKFFYALSVLLTIVSIAGVALFGLKPGIEFTGGGLSEISYVGERPSIDELYGALSALPLGTVLVQQAGEKGMIVRVQELPSADRAAFLSALSVGGTYTPHEDRFDLVGPSIGTELARKAWVSIALVVAGIMLFIAFAFRGISDSNGSENDTGIGAWHYGTIALIVLVHDLIVPTGVFAILGHWFINAQIDTLFVTALLVILGYSVHDTIVVFDRVRENLKKARDNRVRIPFDRLVGESLSQTFGRSINTSLTVVIVLIALLALGSAATANFVLVLLIGILAGTYSSIFLGTPLLVTVSGWKQKSSTK